MSGTFQTALTSKNREARVTEVVEVVGYSRGQTKVGAFTADGAGHLVLAFDNSYRCVGIAPAIVASQS